MARMYRAVTVRRRRRGSLDESRETTIRANYIPTDGFCKYVMRIQVFVGIFVCLRREEWAKVMLGRKRD